MGCVFINEAAEEARVIGRVVEGVGEDVPVLQVFESLETAKRGRREGRVEGGKGLQAGSGGGGHC